MQQTLLQSATTILLQNATEVYYKYVRFFIKNAIVLLQNATAITKCDDFITKCDSYYKLRQCKRQGCYQIETSQLICRANQLTCFYMMATLAFNELRIH